MKKRYILDSSELAGSLEDLERELLQDRDFRLEWTEHQAALRLGRLTHQMRVEAGLSQAELAERIGVAQPVVARIESRRPQRVPQFDTMARVAEACGRRMIISFERKEIVREPYACSG